MISPFNKAGEGRYFDSRSGQSFGYDVVSGKVEEGSVEKYDMEDESTVYASFAPEHFQSRVEELIMVFRKGLLEQISAHAAEHFPAHAVGVYPTDGAIAIIIVANKYSPNNFWNGRWRSVFHYNPSATTLTGQIEVDVHYYEDGNVRLLTKKDVPAQQASDVVKTIAAVEKKYQEQLTRGFGDLSEGAFKGLRRQLPVTRQKVEWEKISGYRVGQDIGGGRFK